MTASDADGNSMTFSIVTPPAHGNLGPIFNQTPTSAQVTYTPNANYNGSDSFTFQADDGQGGTDTGLVTITINPVNDPPTFNLGANPVSSNEDAGAQSIANYASSISPGPTADEASQTVTFTVNNDNNALFSVQPAISPSGTLTYTSAPNANGSANVTVVAHDSGGTANGGNDTSTTHNFNITINAVNDAPSFTKGADQTVLEDCRRADRRRLGDRHQSPVRPTSRARRSPSSSRNDNNALFSAQPAVDADGTLTFTAGAERQRHRRPSRVAAARQRRHRQRRRRHLRRRRPSPSPSPRQRRADFTKGADQTVLEDAGAADASPAGPRPSAPARPTSPARRSHFIVTNNTNAASSACSRRSRRPAR